MERFLNTLFFIISDLRRIRGTDISNLSFHQRFVLKHNKETHPYTTYQCIPICNYRLYHV